MEQFITSTLGSLGVAGIGYFFMYILLKHQLETSKKTIVAVDKLCDKIDELMKSNFKLQYENSESATQASLAYAETKEQYARISASVDEIKIMAMRIFDRVGSNVRLGQVLLQQGLITQEQLDSALDEQKKYL